MKNVVSFLLFVSYATCIFFFPNNQFVALCIIVNLLLMVLLRRSPKRIFVKCMNILPFVLFTLPWYDVCSDWELWKGENSE